MNKYDTLGLNIFEWIDFDDFFSLFEYF